MTTLFAHSLLAAGDGSLWFQSQSSTIAPAVDRLFYLILAISLIFFVLIIGMMTWFVIRYRRREGHEVEESASHNTALEVTWTVLPSLLLVWIFFEGFVGYLDMRTAPTEALEVQVVAKKWSWSFVYPNGYVDSVLHVPVDQPVRLVMSSDDVIHSFFVPAFRVKMDIVPGRYTKTWFSATQPGNYSLFCAEYCGEQHSDMITEVVVHPAGEYETWLADASNFLERMPPAEAGELLYNRRGCAQCHSLDGSAKAGPSFYQTFGTEQQLADGTTVKVDENYIRQSILEPHAQVRAGFRPVMPTYQGQLKDAEISAIIEFLKTVK